MEEKDRSKRDPDVARRLFIQRLSWRIAKNVCLECGTAEHVVRALCGNCRQLPRYQRLLREEEPMANIDQATREKLASFGLFITLHSDPSSGWGYTWHGRDWTGPFPTPEAALHAAFTDAGLSLQFRSDYSWVEFAQSGETWRYGGEAEGWSKLIEQE
jgi:hypothetical protein